MGKAQKKTGKGRLDKYYKLAKEQGYRARSAFKLIQLNKKYSFLESARCCIDLCAAPGGWLQVASKYMPVNSLIVGVDLDTIKPIPRVSTFVSDITTAHCRNQLRAELKDWKADVVLHDGAPNVGTAWVQDAYTQSELVLMSLKLAVEFLVKGGTFVTKVFRSVDYNNLIWVFSQLFGKVEATKPPSSRNVSAEIFVVCRDFHAPKHVDPKFLDPVHVFKDLAASVASGDKGTSAGNVQANVFQPERKRRKRDGYQDGDYILFKKVPVSDFIRSSDPISVLGSVSKMVFESEEEKEWAIMAITTNDVKANLEDLKVLGKGDFKILLKWRTVLREEIGLEGKADEDEEPAETAEVTEVNEDEEIQAELERLNAEAAARTKRERRKANEVKQRTIQRMQLQMSTPLDIGLEQSNPGLGLGGEDVFDLGDLENGLEKRGGISRFAEEDEDESSGKESPEEEMESDGEVLDTDDEREKKTKRLEGDLDGLYDAYRERLAERDAKFKVKEARRKNKEREEWHGIKNDAEQYEENDASEEGGWDQVQKAKGRDDDSSSDDSNEDEGEDEDEKPLIGQKRRRPQETRFVTKLEEPRSAGSKAVDIWFSQNIFGGVDELEDVEDDESDEEASSVVEDSEEGENSVDGTSSEVGEPESPSDDDDFEVVPQESDDITVWDVEDGNEDDAKQEHIRKHGLLTAEAVTLAQQLVNRKKTKTELINDGFTRYSLNSKEDLPSWFLDDESKHYMTNIPITKEAVIALRAKQRALDARPIKKVAEAKARKKFKAAQRLEKAMKKAEGVTQTDEISEREKAQQIEKLMHKGLSKGKKKKEIKVVVAKGAHKGVKGRPKGIKGRYTMVDSRMKKEVRAKKRKEKENKKRKRT